MCDDNFLQFKKNFAHLKLIYLASKRIKYPGINLPKEAKDMYLENYKTLMKETEDITNG